MGRVVLVTGVSRDLGAVVARDLAADPAVDKVVGLDVHPPRTDLTGVKYVRADIRTPVVGKVLAVEDVDTVVHLGVGPSTGSSGGRGATKEVNVIGTMQLLAACQRAETVRRFVLQSSTAVYGTSARSAAMFTESMPPTGGVRSGFPKDSVEVEGYVRGFGRRRPDVSITTFRAAMVLSDRVSNAMTAYYSLPVLPGVLGFDPRLQFAHLDDVRAVLRLAAVEDRPGTFNVNGEGVMTLSQTARRLGKPVVRVPSMAFGPLARSLAGTAGVEAPTHLAGLLTHGRACDTTALRSIFGYTPTHSSQETFDAYARTVDRGPLTVGGARG